MQTNVPSKRPDLQAVVAHAPLIIWSVGPHGLITVSEGKGLQAIGLVSRQLVIKRKENLYL